MVRTKMEVVVNGIRDTTDEENSVDDGGSRRVFTIKVLGLVSANQSRRLDLRSRTLGQVLVEADELTHAGGILLGTASSSGGSEIWWDQSLGRVSATQNGTHVVLLSKVSVSEPQPLYVMERKN